MIQITVEQVLIAGFGIVFTTMLAMLTFFVKRLIFNLDSNTKITQFLVTEIKLIKAFLKIPSGPCPDEGKS